MATATNIDATAVNTIALALRRGDDDRRARSTSASTAGTSARCEQLLADIRAVADSDDRHMHFIGSILSSLSARRRRGGAGAHRRPAAHHDAHAADRRAAPHREGRPIPPSPPSSQRVLVRADRPARAPSCGRTGPGRRCSRASCSTGARPAMSCATRASTTTTRSSAARSAAEEAPQIWRGLQKLEHVAITLGVGANAQQIFESLNSTGEPLRDHELIHNYVLMGLSHAEQSEIEDSFWVPIEQNTGESIGSFWRHYLVMTTGREVAVRRRARRVRRVPAASSRASTWRRLRAHAAEWREYSEIYRVLLEPAHAPDAEIARQLGVRQHVRTRACTRSSCAPTATTRAAQSTRRTLHRNARARAVAAAAPHASSGVAHRSARRAAVPRARRRTGQPGARDRAASRRRMSGSAWR